jgi:hypothetical protein
MEFVTQIKNKHLEKYGKCKLILATDEAVFKNTLIEVSFSILKCLFS